jgi:hypothetical protein
MPVKLQTSTGEMYFNASLISRVHLSSDHSMITMHFVKGIPFNVPAETAEDRKRAAEFLVQLTAENSGFLASGKELLNLRAALWVTIPDDGPILVRTDDNRTHSLPNEDPEKIRRTLAHNDNESAAS